MWLIHAIYWCRRFYGYFHGFILSVLFNSRSDWWQSTQAYTVCSVHSQGQRERSEFEQSISKSNNNNRHVFKFSQLYGYSAIFCNNFFLVIAHIIQLCKSFFCPQLLYFMWIPKTDMNPFFYLHYCQFHHLIYVGTCRTVARTNHWNNLPLPRFESNRV